MQITTLLKLTCFTKINRSFNSKGGLYCVKNYSFIGIPMPVSMSRFPNGRFPGFCPFRIEKKEFAGIFIVNLEDLNDG